MTPQTRLEQLATAEDHLDSKGYELGTLEDCAAFAAQRNNHGCIPVHKLTQAQAPTNPTEIQPLEQQNSCLANTAKITYNIYTMFDNEHKKSTKMKPQHKIAYNYAQANLHQAQNTLMLDQALNTLGSDNQVFSLCEPLEAAYTTLVHELLGDTLFEWLMWWMYESEHGTQPQEFILDGVHYDPTTMTLYKFLELVDARS